MNLTPSPVSATAGPAVATGTELQRKPLHLESILVPLDLSEKSRIALRHAVPLALQFGARLTLLHVVEPPPPFAAVGVDSEKARHAKEHLERFYDDEVAPEITASLLVRHGTIFDQIVSVAREVRADLIVTTTHGRTGMRHLITGSTAECIVHGAPCAVLVVREPAEDEETR